jgi:hypothetical protein
MKTMLLAAAAALSVGVGSAYAGDGAGANPVHQDPGVVAHSRRRFSRLNIAGAYLCTFDRPIANLDRANYATMSDARN